MKSDILIACALKKEAKALRKFLPDSLEVTATGLGTDRTLQALDEIISRRRPGVLLFTGMAGQLDPELSLGDFIFPVGWRMEEGKEFSSSEDLLEELRRSGWNIGGLGLTVRRPVVKEKDRLRLFRETGARICDMESAAALMVAAAHDVPCLAPKIISDTSDSGMLAFYRNFDRNVALLAEKVKRLSESLAGVEFSRFRPAKG